MKPQIKLALITFLLIYLGGYLFSTGQIVKSWACIGLSVIPFLGALDIIIKGEKWEK